MKNYFSLLLYTSVLGLFLAYWFSTILYCSPNNFIRIKSNQYINLFGSYFYQRWTFFTPPPKEDQRLYFLFVSRQKPQKIYKCEVLKPIQDKKRESPLFNNTYEVLDNIISGCAITLNNSMVETSRYLKQKYPDSTKMFHWRESARLICTTGQKLPAYRTLTGYARIVAKKNGIDWRKYALKIIMTTIPIKNFRNRYDTKMPEERIVLETPIISI